MNESFGQRLSRLRKEKGLTQEEIAKRITISPQAVSKWENDLSSPDILVLSSLADILGVSVDELLGREEASEEKQESKSEEPKAEEVEQEVVNERAGITIDKDGFHAETQGGSYIHFDKQGIHVNNAKTGKSYEIKDDDVIIEGESLKEKRKKEKAKKAQKWIPAGTIFGLSIIGYILMGLLWPDGNMGWTCGWTLILFAISLDSIFEAVAKKKFCVFAYPIFITAAYCLLSYLGNYFSFQSWNYWWFLFITIPVYYIIFGPIDSRIAANKKDED